MTWHTSMGDRVLQGAEELLVRDVLSLMVDELEEFVESNQQDLDFEVGVVGFDSLAASAKIASLKLVAEYLLEDTPTTLELTAVSEAMVYAIYRFLLSAIEMEIEIAEEIPDEEGEMRFYWRSLALGAYQQLFDDEDEDEEHDKPKDVPDDETCVDLNCWDSLVEILADCILWDRDFEMDGLFLDVAPEIAQLTKKQLGIEDDYFTEIAPDIAENEIAATLKSLRGLLRKKPR